MNTNTFYASNCSEEPCNKFVTLKGRIENIKETSQNIFAAAYQLRKNLFGEDQLEKAELLPAKCMMDDIEQIYTFLSEAYNMIQSANERII